MIGFDSEHPVMQAPAMWHPDGPRGEGGDGWAVVLFRRVFTLEHPTASASVWVTASQRFELFLNGARVARGPARSDPRRWNVPRVVLGDLANGEHVLAASVWHGGQHAGKAQLGGRAFFLITSDDERLREELTNPSGWRCWWDRSLQPQPERAGTVRGHVGVGSGEVFEAESYPSAWDHPGFHDSDWSVPRVVCERAANPWGNLPLGHDLRPEPIPAMREYAVSWARVAAYESDSAEAEVQSPTLHVPVGFYFPPHTRTRIVLDRGVVTNAYPTLCWAGGEGARMRLVWCEAPLDPITGGKGDRGEVEGRTLPGLCDVIRCGKAYTGVWEPLWFRSFRYLEWTVETADEPLAVQGPELAATEFPLERRRSPRLPEVDPNWAGFLDMTDRTARLCSHETFFDCPHYEQSQFPGDARILARYHYAVYDEDRLARKAIDDLHAGRTHTGLLRSHWPSRMEQVISTYSLAWIGMLHDFLAYRGEGAFLRPYLPAARAILDWFDLHRRGDGLVGHCEAPFTDWAEGFTAGNAPQGDASGDGGSSIVTAMVAQAAGELAELERACGVEAWSTRWQAMAASCGEAVRARCWDDKRRILADTPDRRHFSVHAQVQATLAGVLGEDEAGAALRRAMREPTMVQPGTLYYHYWLGIALLRCGERDAAAALLDDWLAMLRGTGLTTWPEANKPDPPGPRSDCHGWSVGGELLLHHLDHDHLDHHHQTDYNASFL